MVRIKGANSDYKYVGNAEEPIKEDKSADPLYMEIFICPNDQPSKIEQHEGESYCQGTDKDCPSQEKTGHAKIRLDQEQGIILSVKDTEALQVTDGEVGIFDKALVIKRDRQNTSGLIIQFGEAQISLKDNGEIELQGKVSITGELVLPEAAQNRLKAEIIKGVLAQIKSLTF
ncbi:MAG: hypothetical protein AAGJ08_00350 [Cyanobacteria bacterium P01_H01_bin.35]